MMSNVIYHKAFTCVTNGLYDEALSLLDTEIAENPDNSSAKLHRAEILMCLGQTDKAIEQCSSVIEELNGSGDSAMQTAAYYQRGCIHNTANNQLAAFEDFEICNELEPAFFPARLSKAHIFANEQNHTMLFRELDLAVESAPYSCAPYAHRGLYSYAISGVRERALGVFNLGVRHKNAPDGKDIGVSWSIVEQAIEQLQQAAGPASRP